MITKLYGLIKTILLIPFKLLALFVGKFSWAPPAWTKAIYAFSRHKPKMFWGAWCVILASGAGYLYYDSLPKPVSVKAEIYNIQLTSNYENAKPNNLSIRFEYDYSKLNEDQQRPTGSPSVARIDLVGEEIKSGITLSPEKKGTWKWLDDRRIEFVPDTDWPAGTDYKISFDKSIFITEARLSDDTYEFSTPRFNADIKSIEFYQDPQDITVRRVISTIGFSHPVDKSSFEEKISMTMRPSGSGIDADAKDYKFEITYDKNLREAYVQSEPVTLPGQPNYMKIKVSGGVKTILGGEALDDDQEDKVLIPDIYSFLRVGDVKTEIVRNSKNDPEQILFIEFTDDIDEKEILSKLSMYLLPDKSYYRAGEITKDVLASSEKIDFKVFPNERSHSKLYSFFIDVPENRNIYIEIGKGLTSVNKFVLSNIYNSVERSPAYPKEIDIAGEGSVLTYSGNHKLSVLTRGVPGLKYSIGKLLEGQLYHLISQTSGDITNPNFNNWSFNSSNIAEYFEETSTLNAGHPKEANYASIDLSKYMPESNNRFGLFFVEVKAWDPANNREVYGVSDKRLILVTDLGIIVKNNSDNTHDLFVQSVQTGRPVSGAKIELLGKNGIALYTKYTDAQGHSDIPSTNDFTNEKTPTVYVVKTGNDVSFIPYNRNSRQINLSRFDIGGINTRNSNKDSLNAYLFSDRGIYRPGEEVNLGMIVKNFDFSNVEGIPLEVGIYGPRHNVVKEEKLVLPAKGFFDYKYQTDLTSDTGNYKASLYLVRDNNRRGPEIGTVDFKVEEFQPDTMKIESTLLGVKDTGWNNKDNIRVKASLKNLFGTPAQDRKVTGQVIINPSNFSFKEYEGYRFTDPYYNSENKSLSLNEMLETQTTNEDGEVEFSIDLSKFRDGTYALQFVAQGFDQSGGRSVVSQNQALISPLNQLIGYKANGKLDYINSNSKRSIEFIAIDSALKKLGSDNLTFKRIEIQNISTLVKQRNGTYKYQSIKKESEIESRNFSISNAGTIYEINTEAPGNFALEIFDAEERRLARVLYSVIGKANLAGKIDKNAELELKLNKEDYKPGEMIEMNIKAPYFGAGLISIETDKVHAYKWFKTSTESTVQSIQLPENLEGTGYINVSFVRDVSSKEIFTSPLSYAVQPFSIDKSKREIAVALEVKDIVRPGKPMEIKYKASKKSRIAIFAVDEGILQVAKYETPDPLGHFLKKRSLDVQTLQILDLILPDFDLVKELSASGGGARARAALAKNLNPFSRKVDKPAVFWAGILDAGPGEQVVNFDVPDTFAGALRVMAVAVSEDAVGVDTETTIVRGPFVISPNVLTQAAPGDVFSVTVGVANIIDGSGKGAEIALDVKTSEHLEILGDASTVIKIDEGSEGKFTFKVKAKQVLGAADITFIAHHKDEDAKRTASLSIRPAMPYYTSFESDYEKDGKVSLPVRRVLYANLAEQSISASASPLVLVDGLSSYLEHFPHGCTEQVVSQVFPIVGLMTHPAFSAYVPEIDSRISHVVSKLRERQMGDGGFAFWPGSQNTVAYPSIYAMHFLIEARDLGYAVPGDMIDRGKQYLTDFVGQSTNSISSARDRANAIYLLTRLGVVTTNYLVDMQETLDKDYAKVWKKDLLASYMAASYHILQKDQEANALISSYKLSDPDRQSYSDFDSQLTQDAQYIFLLAKHFESEAKSLNGEQILKLTDYIFKGNYNTISASYTILALGAYSKLALNNEFEEDIEFKGTNKDKQEIILEAALKPFLKAAYPVNIQQLDISGEKPLFYLNVQSGFDEKLPEKPVRDQLEIYRDFLDENGNKITSFEQGKEITVRLRVRGLTDKSLTNIAVVDLLPGGFEVVRSSVSRTAYNWRAEYVDVREDRVVYYGSIDSAVRDLTYNVKLTAEGEFVIPPSYAESMYDRSIRAISESGKFIVTSHK